MMNGTTVSPASAFPAIQSHMGLPLERGARGHPAPGSPTLPHTIITHHHHHPSSHATSTWNPRSPQASPSTLSNPSSPLGLCCQKNTHRPPRHPTTGGGAPKRPGDERHWSNFVQIYFDNFPLRPQRVHKVARYATLSIFDKEADHNGRSRGGEPWDHIVKSAGCIGSSFYPSQIIRGNILNHQLFPEAHLHTARRTKSRNTTVAQALVLVPVRPLCHLQV